MSDFSNNLTDAEVERLAILLEELGEALQIIGKILRHGYESFNPLNREAGTNKEMLEHELGHVKFSIDMLETCDDVSRSQIEKHKQRKSNTIRQYLHHQDWMF